MDNLKNRRLMKTIGLSIALILGGGALAVAQTNTPAPPAAASGPTASPKDASQPKPTPAPSPAPATPAPATPSTTTQPSATPPTPPTTTKSSPTPGTQSPQPNPVPQTPGAATPPATPEGTPLAPAGKPQRNEIERNGSPGIPDNATTENVVVPERQVEMVKGQSTYDDAFKSIKASLDTVKKALDKAGIKPTGHPITIFSEPDDKGFKFQAAIPVAQPSTVDLGDAVTASKSPSGKAIKFQHRGAYDDIDSTYDVITAFLDAKGMQVDSPYIEEYLTDLTTSDDPNLQVDIYVFVK